MYVHKNAMYPLPSEEGTTSKFVRTFIRKKSPAMSRFWT